MALPLVCALLCDALMPVVCLDPMLPGQKLDIVSTDRTLGELVRTVGAGGSLAMIGIDVNNHRDGHGCRVGRCIRNPLPKILAGRPLTRAGVKVNTSSRLIVPYVTAHTKQPVGLGGK